MKKVLELSIDDKEQAEQREYERKSVKEKINSYVDLVDMKARTKQLFDEITDAEKDITILKNRKNSMNRILSDNEKINQKKIEDLEQECKVLETKITSDKEELLSIKE
jgi:predicted RNase H-like nuclease (RuvC/YqgF family)